MLFQTKRELERENPFEKRQQHIYHVYTSKSVSEYKLQ